MFDFPAFLTIEKKKAVVVGGGVIAHRKVENLLAAKAEVTVVAPEINEKMMRHYQDGAISWIKDICKDIYLHEAFIIISASGDKEAQAVIKKAAATIPLINGADNPSLGNFAFPATVETPDVHIAVSTFGNNPTLAKQVKQKIAAILPEWLNSH